MAYWRIHRDYDYAFLQLVEENVLWRFDYLHALSSGVPKHTLDTWPTPRVRFIRDDEIIREVENSELPSKYLRGSNITVFEGLDVWDAKARQCLEPLVGDCVEMLPLECGETGGSPLWAVNVIRVVDCLDHKQSEFTYFKSGSIKGIRRYVFKPGCLEGQHLFRMPEHNYGWVIASDTFKNRVKSCGLTGLEFELAWG